MPDDQTAAPAPQRVERTGLALVHEGERIYPAEGSAAVLSGLGPTVVNYYFPVEIEIIGARMEALLEEVYGALRLHFEALVS
ncbi:MAG: hypothetical protein JO110_06820 [Acetobacteraceae bacterium]|nr:hypothetical protein [Acetobacteraceae bacterium]